MLWWLSFCDPDRPKGSQLLGVSIITAESMEEAITRSWMLGCNPGGEVAGCCLPAWAVASVPAAALHRLLAKPEALWLDRWLAEQAPVAGRA
jgi:hypothetical protein